MPKVRPYESQVSPGGEVPTAGASLSEVGGPGAVNLGQSIVNAGYSGAHAYQIIQANEDAAAVSDAHVKLAQIAASETQRFQDFSTKADPADPNVWDSFRRGGATPDEEVPRVDSLQYKLDALNTATQNPIAKRAVAQGAAQLSQHFLDKTVVLSGQLAGIQAKNQLNTYIDAQGTRVQTDPTEFYGPSGALAQTKQYFDTAFPKMTVAWRDQQYQESKNKLAANMVRGMLNDPGSGQMVKARLERGDYDGLLTDEAKVTLHSQAMTNIQAWETEQNRARAEAMRQQKEGYEATGRTLTSKFLLHEDTPTNPMTPPLTATEVGKKLLNNELDDNTGRALFGMIDARASRAGSTEQKSNLATKRKLFEGIANGTVSDITPITDAYLGKGYKGVMQLSDSDNDWLLKKFYDAKSPDGDSLSKDFATFYERVPKQAILKPGPFGIYADSTKGGWYDKYIHDVEDLKQQYIKAGKNPRDLIDPSKPEYVGSQKFVEKYANQAFGEWPTGYVPPLTPVPTAPVVPGQVAPPRKSLNEIFGRKP